MLDEATPLEDAPQERLDAYGFGKLKQEEIVRGLRQFQGLIYVILRPGMVFGPGKNDLLAASVSTPSVSSSTSAGQPSADDLRGQLRRRNCQRGLRAEIEARFQCGGRRTPDRPAIPETVPQGGASVLRAQDSLSGCYAFCRAWERYLAHLKDSCRPPSIGDAARRSGSRYVTVMQASQGLGWHHGWIGGGHEEVSGQFAA